MKGKHATSPKTAKHLTHTKAPQATQSTQAIQTYIQQQKPRQKALKMRNKPYFKGNTPQAKQQSDQKAGSAPRKEGTTPKPYTPAPVDTPKGRQPTTSPAVFLPAFQKYLCILPVVVSEIPEKTPTTTK